MQLKRIEQKASMLGTLAQTYEDLANKQIFSEKELEETQIEMRLIKEQMLTEIIDAKKLIKKDEKETKV